MSEIYRLKLKSSSNGQLSLLPDPVDEFVKTVEYFGIRQYAYSFTCQKVDTFSALIDVPVDRIREVLGKLEKYFDVQRAA